MAASDYVPGDEEFLHLQSIAYPPNSAATHNGREENRNLNNYHTSLPSDSVYTYECADHSTQDFDVDRGPLTDPPKDYFCYAVFAMILCFPMGFTALQSSRECRMAIALRNKDIADAKSEEARSRANLALLLGITTLIVIAAFIVLGVLPNKSS